MTVFRAAALVALVALTGCGEDQDQTSITLLSREMSYDRSYFTFYPLMAEVHNSPFDGVSKADVAAMLRMPPSYADAGAFALSAPGETPRPKVRLALAFNSRAPVSAKALCRASAALGAATPLDDSSFMVDVALCRDDDVIASASMTAKAGKARDPAFAARSLNHLMLIAFGNNAERDQWER